MEDDVLVEIVMVYERDGRDYAPVLHRAGDLRWSASLYDTFDDIVAYKVVKQ